MLARKWPKNRPISGPRGLGGAHSSAGGQAAGPPRPGPRIGKKNLIGKSQILARAAAGGQAGAGAGVFQMAQFL